MADKGGYEVLASVYDALNSEIDYHAWADFIEKVFCEDGAKKISSVVDLGCGTGSMTLELARRGYDMIGVDNSFDMLSVARERDIAGGGHGILWLEQDLAEFELYGTVDAAVCCLDCVNHLTKKADVEKFFGWVHNYLEPDGLFLFDVNSPAKFENVYGNNDYILESDGAYCGWQNEYNPKSGLCTFYLTVFAEQEDGSFVRADGVQKERCYSERTLNRLLTDTGFEIIGRYAGFDFEDPDENSDRWYYVARAKK